MDTLIKSSRRVIRTLIRQYRYYSDAGRHGKDCPCYDCKCLKTAQKEVKKLTEIIEANKRCRAIYNKRCEKP